VRYLALLHKFFAVAALLLTAACAQTFQDCADCPEMVVVPAGSFMMGDLGGDGRNEERPIHPVSIEYPFAVGRFEVTFDQWNACAAEGGCSQRPADEGWGQADRPVINVNTKDAGEYLAWLNQKAGVPEDAPGYRLLSEAEWEYAARARTTTRYFWGDEVGIGNATCWGCGSQWDRKMTAPVGSFAANAFGLHDMHGNVSEWVEDCETLNYKDVPADGSAWKGGGRCSVQITRGGYWAAIPDAIRSAYRRGAFFDARGNSIGFRVAKSL
jgi:formylglycine-generating enzyme required for sulfatase activity